MNATLPDESILKVWFPDVDKVGEIEVPMPHARVRHILGAPITKKKLTAKRNLRAMRRYILQRWVETGRGRTLVICQKDIEAALRATGLPTTIAVEHFNAIEGLDQYKDVRLLITVGRTQPEPAAVEADAGALTGIEPTKAAIRANRSPWYDRVIRGVRMRDGTGVGVECDRHPDELAEAIRYQICEAELMQAIGRGRGVSRTAETPLDVDILADVVLPITVDRIDDWRPPGLEVEMIAEGVWLKSAADMARAWPDVWATAQAARDWLKREQCGISLDNHTLQGKFHTVRLLQVRYQRAGPKQHWHHAWVDPAVVPDARAWLAAQLGPLSGYEVVAVL
jgi:putative DNA primase/helicase